MVISRAFVTPLSVLGRKHRRIGAATGIGLDGAVHIVGVRGNLNQAAVAHFLDLWPSDKSPTGNAGVTKHHHAVGRLVE